ncbi:MAG: hypothetical protein PF505_09425 [Vallitaleaceae bacterium]|jgi:transcription-repair coupling factor (superfamily II helicase)|nr:hypothetical protein [Vallitaleaceae bacterium]
MENIIKPLLELEAYASTKVDIARGNTPIYLTGIVDAAKAHMIHSLSGNKQKLVITYNEMRAKELVEDLRFFEKDKVYLYPARDMIFYSADVHSNDLLRERLDVINQLVMNEPVTVVLSIEALLDSIVHKALFAASILHITSDHTIKMNELIMKLSQMGFERTSQVESRGQFAIRGGIIDIFPVNSDEMFRIELWGDVIDSMRSVNPETQRTMYDVTEIMVMPAREMLVNDENIKLAGERIQKEHTSFRNKLVKNNVEPVILEHLDKSVSALLEKVNNNGNFNGIEGQIYYYYEEEDIVSIMDYFDEPIIYLDEPARIKQRLTTIKTEFDESMKNRLEKGYLLPSQMKVYHQPSHILKFIENSTAILMSTLYQNENLLPFKVRHEVLSKSVNAYNPNFELWIKDLKYYIGKDYKILFLTGT